VDGFRSLASIDNGRYKLVSPDRNEFKSFSELNLALPVECRAKRTVLMAKWSAWDQKGNSQFRNLLFHRGGPRFYAFDLLSSNGEYLCYFPVADRKHRLRGVVPPEAERLFYCDHIEERGSIYSALRVSAIRRALSRSGSSIHTARQCEVVQNQESELLAVARARGIIRA
jgi:ATP-dependent DNA ligase